MISDIGVCAVVWRGDRILLGVRAGTGEWSCPGGHVMAGESFEDAAVREVLEETGLHVTHPCAVDALLVWPIAGLCVTVACLYDGGTPVDSAELTDLGWFRPSVLPAPLFRREREMLADRRGYLSVATMITQPGANHE